MDNQTGLAFLSSVLDKMSYPNQILSPGKDNSKGIDVGVLHRLLMKGCYITGQDDNQTNIQGKDNTKGTTSNDNVGTSKTINFFIKTLIGTTIQLSIRPSAKVEDLKDMIRSKEGVPVDQQRLFFQRTQLEDTKTFLDYNIGNDSTLRLGLKLRGGGGLVLPPSLLDEPYHYDFTNISDNGVKFCRGGLIYIRPCGWQRYALNVKGKFPDDIWLEGKTSRADKYSSAEDEWPVSYHGTSYHNGLSIAEEGYKLSKATRFKHGKGIYSTPDIEVAFIYASEANVNGKTYKVVMQNRVNPTNLKKVDKAVTGVGEFWISPNDDDIRPYGFCVREV